MLSSPKALPKACPILAQAWAACANNIGPRSSTILLPGPRAAAAAKWNERVWPPHHWAADVYKCRLTCAVMGWWKLAPITHSKRFPSNRHYNHQLLVHGGAYKTYHSFLHIPALACTGSYHLITNHMIRKKTYNETRTVGTRDQLLCNVKMWIVNYIPIFIQSEVESN